MSKMAFCSSESAKSILGSLILYVALREVLVHRVVWIGAQVTNPLRSICDAAAIGQRAGWPIAAITADAPRGTRIF
jgi:hypothetical protein